MKRSFVMLAVASLLGLLFIAGCEQKPEPAPSTSPVTPPAATGEKKGGPPMPGA